MTPNPASLPLSAPSYPPELLLALANGTPTGAELALAQEMGLVKINAKYWWLSVSGDAAVNAPAPSPSRG